MYAWLFVRYLISWKSVYTYMLVRSIALYSAVHQGMIMIENNYDTNFSCINLASDIEIHFFVQV